MMYDNLQVTGHMICEHWQSGGDRGFGAKKSRQPAVWIQRGGEDFRADDVIQEMGVLGLTGLYRIIGVGGFGADAVI